MNVENIANALTLEIIGPLELQSVSEPYLLRRMHFDDIDQVFALEEKIFPSPWSRCDFIGEVQNESWSLPLVVEHKEEVIGYSVSWIMVDELYIANVAIAPAHRRRRISETMMAKLIRLSAGLGIRIARLEVRRSNHPAIALYRKLGFEIIGVRKGYYEDNNEDALLMSRELTNSEEK